MLARANELTDDPSYTRSCGSGLDTVCCEYFCFNIDRTTDTLVVDLTGPAQADTHCINFSCILSGEGIAYHQTITLVENGHLKLMFTPVLGSGEDTLKPFCFSLCAAVGSVLCEHLWDHIDWHSSYQGTPNDSGSFGIGWCRTGFNCGAECDQVTVLDMGDYKLVCLKHNSMQSLTSIDVNFSPPLAHCPGFNWDGSQYKPGYSPGDTVFTQRDTCVHLGGPSGGYDSCWVIDGWYIADHYTPPQPEWACSGAIFDPKTNSETYHFTLADNYVLSCNTWCMHVPECDGMKRRITITPSPTSCAPIVIDSPSFKPAYGSVISDEPIELQNFPNPFGQSTMFRTAIPFATKAEGEAVITVTDASGKLIVEDEMTVMSAGRHFFYFSGKGLPSGTYYYKIPRGVTIVNKTMLLVK